MPSSLIDNVVEGLLKRMALWNYRDKLAGDYSGGNKRKLSVAIALLGDPKVLYLDEPSTGMDAHSRRYRTSNAAMIICLNLPTIASRFMWDLISQQAKNRAVRHRLGCASFTLHNCTTGHHYHPCDGGSGGALLQNWHHDSGESSWMRLGCVSPRHVTRCCSGQTALPGFKPTPQVQVRQGLRGAAEGE